jgi:hypothetical protein
LSCGEVSALFNSVAAMKRATNNGTLTRDRLTVASVPGTSAGSQSGIDRFKQKSRDRWGLGKKQ